MGINLDNRNKRDQHQLKSPARQLYHQQYRRPIDRERISSQWESEFPQSAVRQRVEGQRG